MRRSNLRSLSLPSILPGTALALALLASAAGAQRLPRRDPAPIPFRGGPERILPAGLLSVPRAAHTATLLGSGNVLIAGGLGSPGSTEFFDSATMSFSPGPPLLESRAANHSATLLTYGRVLIAGGWQNGRPLATSEIYDAASGVFSLSGRMTTNRAEHTATLLASGDVLLTGGVAASYDQPFLSSAELYNSAAGTFRPTGSLITPRRAHIATLLADGRVLVTGGSSARGNVLASAEIYDPLTGSFDSAGGMTVPRYKHAAALLPDGKVLVVGGSDARDDIGRYASSELFDPAAGAFVPGADMIERRYKLPDAVAALPGGNVLVGGGGERVEIYDPAARDFHAVEGSLDDGRLFMTATLLRGGAVLLAGGYGYRSNLTAQAWIYFPAGVEGQLRPLLREKAGVRASQPG